MIKLSTSRALRQTKERTYRVNKSIIGKYKQYNYYYDKKENAIAKAREIMQNAREFNLNYVVKVYNQNTYEEIEF